MKVWNCPDNPAFCPNKVFIGTYTHTWIEGEKQYDPNICKVYRNYKVVFPIFLTDGTEIEATQGKGLKLTGKFETTMRFRFTYYDKTSACTADSSLRPKPEPFAVCLPDLKTWSRKFTPPHAKAVCRWP